MYKNSFSRVVSLLLTAVFLLSYPTGSAALALCLDQEENHVVEQNLYLDKCHSFSRTYLPLSDEHCSALAEQENNDCIDVSLSNSDTLNLPSKIVLAPVANTLLSYTLPANFIGTQEQVTGRNSFISLLQPPTSFHLNSLRTIVLLI